MPDRIMYGVVGLWAVSLAALLTVGWHVDQTVGFVLFGLMMGSAAFIVANCFGVLGLLRLLTLSALVGVGIGTVLQILPKGVGEVVDATFVPLATVAGFALVERRKRSRRRTIVVTTNA